MQTQLEHMSKKNKITVPFYSPPTRLYGQTPAEIIKEARAAVMNPPTIGTVGIKPVFTSRPFTPKEKERTLFGNIKKRNSRPPSTFSLRNLQSQDACQRVKLPSIDINTKRKIYTTFHYSNNLSLDNLTEDYDAEALEEIDDADIEKLPKWKKAHSCPKEGRMLKAASFNEISAENLLGNVKLTECRKSKKEKPEIILRPDFDFLVENSRRRKNELCPNTSTNIGDQLDNKTSKPFLLSSEINKNFSMTQGGGDWQEMVEVSKEAKPELNENLSAVSDYITLKQQPEEIKNEEVKIVELEPKELKIDKDSIETSENKQNDDKKEEKLETKEQEIGKVSEKAVGTPFKSDYLAMKQDTKNTSCVRVTEPLPLEILELYETARYYGVDVGDNDSRKIASSQSNTKTKVDDYFGEEPLDYLEQLKENSIKLNEKMNNLNEAAEKMRVQRAEIKEKSSENIEFVMNNKKRYHVTPKKGDTKEKAYKKWNYKQEITAESKPEISDEGWDLFWKNSYYKSKDEDEETVENQNKQKVADLECLKRLVDKITGMTKKGTDNSDIYETTTQLYNLIKNSRTPLDSQLKSDILKALYLYADIESPQVLLSLARLLLHLKVESSLPVAFKMIFKVARLDTNDHLFLNEEDVLELFLDGIGRSSPLDSAESCIYGYGALKFLTMNHNILSRILHMGALDLMTLHLKMINTSHMEKGSVGEQTQHALFQLTGALRHVAAGEGALPLFLTTNCITIICRTLQLFHKDDDIVTNISRTLSLLSADEAVTQVLMSIENFLTTIVDLIEQYKDNDKILIRLSYCLGNIVEHSDLARVQLSRNETSLTILLNALKIYIDKDLEISMKEDGGKNSEELSSETIDDIIVKVIRIIANMSMNPIVGSNLSPTTNEKKSLQLSKLLSVLLMRKDPGIALLATLGCLNNISYYCNTHSVLIDITQGVERVLGLPSEDCQAEAARVLGNLTRHKEIRDLIYSTGGVNQLIKLLSSQDQEVVKCACGALVNMMLDAETRKEFVKDHGIDKLVKALELFCVDWSLASLAARAIWNSCADDLSSAMLNNNMEHLLNILANSLEEENWNDGDPAWEEFASIATDLLERINSHLEST